MPEPALQEANALVGLVNNLAEFLGPALATALVLGAGAGFAFAIDAATFLVSVVLLAGVRPRPRGAEAARTSMVTELREGWDAVRARAWVWVTIVAFCGQLLVCLAPLFVLGPLVAEGRYGSTGIYGLVMAALGAGTVAGALIGVRWRPLHPMRLGLILAPAWPLAVALFAAGLSLLVVVPVTAVAGAGISLFEIWWLTALAERIPPHLLSRATSYDWMGSLALLPLGYLLAGPLADALGATEVLFGGSPLGALLLALGLLPRETRMLERLAPASATPPATAARPTGLPVA